MGSVASPRWDKELKAGRRSRRSIVIRVADLAGRQTEPRRARSRDHRAPVLSRAPQSRPFPKPGAFEEHHAPSLRSQQRGQLAELLDS